MNKSFAMNRCLLVILLSFLPLWTMAQDARPHKTDQERRAEREAIRAQKVAFITQEVGLTAGDAEKFWPLYNELEQKVMEVGHERGRSKAEMYRLLEPFNYNNSGKGTEPAGVSQGRSKTGDHRAPAQPVFLEEHPKGPPPPIDKLLESYILTFEKETRLRSEYHQKFLKVLTAEQVARLYLAEERFSNKLFRDYIDNKLEQKSR